jgi:hypothetical protein
MQSSLVIGVALLLAACGTKSAAPTPSGACAGGYEANVAASDYTSSGIGAVSLTQAAKLTFGVDLGKDPVLAQSGGRVFCVARDVDLLFELDPCGTAITKTNVHQGAPGSGSVNPQDVAVAPNGDLWVPLYNVPTLAIVAKDGTPRQPIDLSKYDPNGNPHASAIRITDAFGAPTAFVALERLDPDFHSRQPSSMLRIDVASAVPQDAITLQGRNPFGITEANGVFYLADPGNFDAADEPFAGIERFDPQTSTSELIAHEKDLGGSVAEVAVSSACGVAIVANAVPNVNSTSLVSFDANTGGLQSTLLVSTLELTSGFMGMTWIAGGHVLLVGERRSSGNGYPIHVFDKSGDCDLAERADTIFIAQKPTALRGLD